jgi:fatty acid synthase
MMTTTAGPTQPTVTGGGPSALPGSLAAGLAAGTHPATLLFPGIDPSWPKVLATALVGRPELAAWVDTVVTELDEWAQTPAVRSMGLFADGFSHLLPSGPDDPVSPVAATGPFALVGNLLTNLVCLAALDLDGLHPATTASTTRFAGHSAGLLAAAVATARGRDGLVPVRIATDAARIAAVMGAHAARHPWAVSDSAVSAALAGSESAGTPMVAISGPRTGRLTAILAGSGAQERIAIGVVNGPTRHILAGDPGALSLLRVGLEGLAQVEAKKRAAGQLGGTPFRFAWEPLASSVPFHHPDLQAAAKDALARISELGLALPSIGSARITDPATGRDLPAEDTLRAIVTSVLARPHDWATAVTRSVTPGTVAIMVSSLGALAGQTAADLRGRATLVIDPGTAAGRTALFTPGGAPAIPETYERFAPRVVRDSQGVLRLANLHTRRSGRSPMILPGMTPSTSEAPIVVAAANGGHVAELAGGGQVTERIFTERIAEVAAGLAPGQEIVVNALFLDPYLWNLQVGRERLVQRARAAGAPINGVTISAGIPDKPEALALLDELAAAGIWLNAFKPGTIAQVQEVLAIAADTPHTVWLHLEGGTAGGHHSWEDLDELLLSTYHLIREHENVVLAVGGGIADPQRAGALLSGTWAHAHGAATMPVDAILLGTVTMATRESAASPSVKAALVAAAGHEGWVARGAVAGGTTSGRSGLNADIHFLDNSAARAARLLDEVAGDAAAVAARREEIVAALAATAKPYFGDVAEMTYAQMLERFVVLTALGRDGRYEDGAWLDSTHRSRFIALLQQAEARLNPADTGRIATLFADPTSVDVPAAALARLLDAYPAARTALLHPADVAHFLSVARRPGKPVPFVPVIDADVRRWYQSDSLWQSHSDLYDADQVLIIPGPVAVAGITTVDEPVARLLDRFEIAVAQALAAADPVGTDARDIADFRLGQNPAAPASGPEALLAAALEAPTWTWLGASRTNPLHQIGSPDEWSILGPVATWSSAEAETAILTVQPDRSLALTLDWPDLGLPGDGELVLPVEVATNAGVITFAVTEANLAAAGSGLLAMFAGGTGGPTSAADVAAAHAATVGSAGALPDRVMSALWPAVFTGLADAGLASSMFDLVHLRHEIALSPNGSDAPATAARPELSRVDGGLVITVDSRVGAARVSDRFFVRRTVVDPALPAATALAEREGVVVTPRRTLGTLTIAAPSQLEAFATVSGDANPIHRSDLLARFVGLPGRIVHGMWTSAAATRAVLEAAAEGNPTRLREWSIDFVAPVLPGQEVTFTVTRTGVRDGARIVAVEASTADGVVALGSAVVAGPRTMYVFPGQGIQSQGMGMEAYARSAAARETWDRADAATRQRLGFSILAIVRDNPTSIEAVGTTFRHPAGVLHLTQFTQVAMATLAMATVAEMREAGVFDPDAAVAGHSVGEYNALGASNGVLTLEAAIELVFARGLGMHGLVPRDEAGNSAYRLAVIRPHLARLSHAQAEELVAAVAADTGELCEIVNHNLRGKQYAVAGTLVSLAELETRLGPGQAGKAPMLLVPGIDVPFHSSALLGGVADFREQLLAKLPERIDTSALVGRYIPNLYPRLFRLDREYVQGVHEVCGSSILADVLADWDTASADPVALARTLMVELLAWQFASPVRWIETFELMCTPVELGGLAVERIVEIGVGSAPTLANLAKGSLALATHRGTRPEILNVEVDAEVVFDTSEDPAPAPEVEPAEEVEQPSAAAAGAAPADSGPALPAPSGGVVADLPVDHATAVAALLALRVGVRVDQLEHDSIESLVDGASSRRNQVLMDIGKEFGVSAMDGAHEVPLVQLTSTLAGRTANYRYPGPVLSAAVEGAVTAALGPRGSSPSALAKRVTAHWGLGEGWIARTALALALGTRDGSSRRGGDLATLSQVSAEGLIDEAVRSAAAEAGVAVSPVSAASAGGGTVDAAAVNELREHVEGILVDQASEVLARLGRVPVSDPLDADYREALATLALLEAEHGPAALVAPMFDPRRHVLLDSATTWARADVDHLVQASLAAEADGEADGAQDGLEGLLQQVVAHRDADPRIRAGLEYHRARLGKADHPLTVALIERALTATPIGVPIPDAQGLRAALDSPDAAAVLAAAELLGRAPAEFGGEVALVTGASPNSIAWSTAAHLLRGGATVVVVTTTDTPERIAAYRDLERRWAGPGAQLHIVRANLASFADIDALIEWMVTPTTEDIGPISREVKPALWPTLVLPFAAAPAMGELPDTGRDAQLTLRLLLLGVQRLVGGLAERAAAARRQRFSVVLPMSPNHGTFGGDGAYGDAKAALETMANKWASEGSRWGAQTRIISAEIGWVRGTGLMAANDRVARFIEDELGVVTYSAEQMGALIAALATPPFRQRADRSPLRLDLSGGLGGRTDLGAALAEAVAALSAAASEGSEDRAADTTVAALPNLPALLAGARGPVEVPTGTSRATVRAEDMIVMVGIAEYGPWGASATRWQAELGELGAAGVVELAWRCGLITWDDQAGGWVDAETAGQVDEAEIGDRYREQVQARSGVRLFEDDAGVAADGVWEFTEAFLDRALTKVLRSEEEARAMAASTPGALVTQVEEGWLLTLPAGASVRIPRRKPLLRSAGGQFPRGSDPVRHGLDSGIAGSMDALTAWNVVITADALADAGVSAEELLTAVHPSLVGNTQGTGMGGMSSISKVFMGPLAGRQYANDVLQEALGNVVSAHVNQGLIGGYGPMVHPVAACATAAVSLEEAVDKIALGKAEIIIGGGWDDLSTEGIIGFANMAATADNEAMISSGLDPRQHSRPGDRRRRGFVESQGGGSFIICRGSVALALGLPVRAVVGYAASFGDGIHTSIPAPGIGALGSVRGGADSPLGRALARLGLAADDVAVVSKHDTSTEANDPNEAFLHETIQQALGRTPGAPLRVISQKSLTGHSKGGAAAWQMAGLCDVFETGTVPGNANLVSADPRVTPGDALVVDYRPLRRAEKVRAALVTSLGFGHVSALVALAHPDVFVEAIPVEQRAGYVQRAHERRVAGARARLGALHGEDPVFARRTDRRLGQGSTHELRDREAGMLLDPAGVLPGLAGT